MTEQIYCAEFRHYVERVSEREDVWSYLARVYDDAASGVRQTGRDSSLVRNLAGTSLVIHKGVDGGALIDFDVVCPAKENIS